MGEIILNKVKGMNWTAKISLVLIFTLVFSALMYQGWYKPKQAQAAIARVGTATVFDNGTATTGTVTIPATTAGNLLVVVISGGAGTGGGSSAVNLGATPMTKAIQSINTSGTNEVTIWYLANIPAAQTTVTWSYAAGTGGTTDNGIIVQQYSGAATVTPVDVTATWNSAATAVTVLNSGTATATAANELWIGGLNCLTSGTWSAPTPAGSTLQGNTVAGATGMALVDNMTLGATANALGATTNGNDTGAGALAVFKVAAAGNLTVGDGVAGVTLSAAQASTNNAIDSFTTVMSAGSGTINTLTLTTSAQFTAANVSNIRLYRDNGTLGTFDGADVLVPSTYTIGAGTATITITTPENVAIAPPANYLITVDIAPAATVGNSLTARVTGATGAIGTPVYNDSTSNTLNITAGAALTVGNSTNPVNANAPQGSIGNGMDGFTMAVSAGSGSINTLTLTGSAQFTSANVSAIKIYHDLGTIGTFDVADTLIPTTTAWAGNVATITFTTAEAINTTVTPYLVVVDVQPTATVGNTLSGTITAATGSGYVSSTYSDTTSGTLTITTPPNLTVGNGTDPASANAMQSTANNAIDSFTMAVSAGSGTINTLTLTTSAQFTATNVSNISVYRDAGTLGVYNAGVDTLVPSTFTIGASTATITFTTAENVTTTVANYLITVDIAPAAVVGNTLTARVTGATGTVGTPTYSDTTSATLTITVNSKLPSTITSCGGCHGYGTTFNDGTARNVPAGTFPGSHNKHVVQAQYVCSVCHVVPATQTSADYGHRNSTILMANPINGETGAAYVKGTSWAQTNNPTAFTACVNTYCHSQGTSKTTNTGETRTTILSAPLTTLVWGTTDVCSSCHGYPPSYPNQATTWGAAKANSHSKHQTQCSTCHNATTTNSTSITGPAQHTNRLYNIALGNGATIGTYTYAASGGTCTNISCHSIGGVVDASRQWGTTLPATYQCVTCHQMSHAITVGPLAGIGTRDPVVSEFGLAWGHKKTGRGAVTDADCIVCHLEGNYTTQTRSTLHGDGYIDLRDPKGAGETEITDMGGVTPFRFAKFSTSYAAGSRWSTYNTSNNIDNVLTQKFCLACHDSTGATNTTARTTGGTQYMPWGGINLGANYTVANGAAVAGGLVNVRDQFAATNSSYHPVTQPLNKDFPTAVRMNDPYKPIGTRGTSGTLSNSVVINCFDCHNVSGASPLTTRTVAAHGNAETIRGVATVSGTPSATNDVTFCKVCHAGYVTLNSGHAAGSAFSSNPNKSGMNPYVNYGCNMCHGSNYATAVVRPVRAMDVHGVNVLPAGSIAKAGRWSIVGTPIAFIRNNYNLSNHEPRYAGGLTYTPGCGLPSGTCAQAIKENYTVGGTY